MPKRKLLQTEDGQINIAEKPKQKRKAVKRRRKIQIEWSQLFRFSVMLLLVGIIVFHYYLITEKALLTYYQSIWNNHKQTLTPLLILVGYSSLIFLIGFWVGKRRR